MARLNDPPYMSFPMKIAETGAAISGRSAHIREQIEQVLATNPGERVFRPDFGVGIMALVFEPNNTVLETVTKSRLTSSLADALKGEVDPKSLEIDVYAEEEKLFVNISYTLAAIGHTERHTIKIGGDDNG